MADISKIRINNSVVPILLQIYNGNKDKYNFYFDHCIYILSLNFIIIIIIINTWNIYIYVLKWRQYTPEPRFQTANQENWKKGHLETSAWQPRSIGRS